MPEPQIENQPTKESTTEKEIPKPEQETSVEDFNNLAGTISHKVGFEAKASINRNEKTGLKAIDSLGGGEEQQKELNRRQALVVAKMISLSGEYAKKIKTEAGLKKPEDLPDTEKLTKKDLHKSELTLKQSIKEQMRFATKMTKYLPFIPMLRPAMRLMTEKAYRDYVIEKAPQVAPVMAKAIITEGASLKNPRDLMVLIDFAVNDPEAPKFLKKIADKILSTKEGQELLAKAGKKIGKKKKKTNPPLAA